MYTELVGNFEAETRTDLSAINFNSTAFMGAQALGLMEARDALKQEAQNCGPTCSCSITGTTQTWATLTWDGSKREVPSQESLLAAALAT